MDTELKRQAAVETGLACHLRPRRGDLPPPSLPARHEDKEVFRCVLHRCVLCSSAQASDVQTVCRSKAVADQTGFRFLAGESFERKAGWGESSASEHASASPARNLSD
ncbi:hypothetical protein PPTG_20678 [Phytophthora nicotianae INRA-310]|uniref:Uncharacterized protein n=1 Tax=Phytophthora nicotianae (strain INRA-310) TaxID=761204 RepID=W2REG0_PHYN3|nr:hypothetical protein PPTG_20678 [Phytophthora nicotianae INRA-310]ETN23631.1 hypothetical protein PPTG_20678 [Phytophthora nicotianae INRA-310]